MTTIVLLAAVVALAHMVETMTGFGATVIALALGVHLLPLEQLLPSLVAVGLVQSTYLVSRHRRHIAWPVLLHRILPLAGLGLAIGATLFYLLAAPALQTLLGVFVIGVASYRLWQLWRDATPTSPQSLPVAAALLIGGGFFHGLFASGGPLIVTYAARAIPDKAAFRVTLSSLWLTLSGILLITYAWTGRLDQGRLQTALYLLPGLLVGIVAGELLHQRVPERGFRIAVQVLLLATGVVLLT
ncbi:MAG: sulfite exporter TauE/SafE family protein [Pseudomonadota bacterium]